MVGVARLLDVHRAAIHAVIEKFQVLIGVVAVEQEVVIGYATGVALVACVVHDTIGRCCLRREACAA